MQPKTLADVKRRTTVGTRLRCVENTIRPILNGTHRRIVQVQTNGFWWIDADAPGQRSWTDYPKAALCTWLDDTTFQLGLDAKRPEHYVRLAFVSQASQED